MILDVQMLGKITVLTVPGGHLDAGNIKEFKLAIDPILRTTSTIVADMSKVDFVDSAGLGTLLSVLRQATASGGDFRLCGLTRPVRALFQLVRMHRVFGIYNDRAEALASFDEA